MKRTLIYQSVWFLTALGLCYFFPQAIWYWMAVWVFGALGSALYFEGLRMQKMQRLFWRGEFQSLRHITKDIQLTHIHPVVRHQARLFYAYCLLCDPDSKNGEIASILESIDTDSLSPKWQKVRSFLQAKLSACDGDFEQAVGKLQTIDLVGVPRLFFHQVQHLTSLCLAEMGEVTGDAYRLAADAYRFRPEDALFQAQFGWLHQVEQVEAGRLLLKGALKRLHQCGEVRFASFYQAKVIEAPENSPQHNA